MKSPYINRKSFSVAAGLLACSLTLSLPSVAVARDDKKPQRNVAASAKAADNESKARSATLTKRDTKSPAERDKSRHRSESRPANAPEAAQPGSKPKSRSASSVKSEISKTARLRRGNKPSAENVPSEVPRARVNEDSLRDDVQAMIAKDDLAGEDPDVRQLALTALGNRAGTVVVMDPKSGRIFSIVNQQWALHEGFKPCSTIKLVTGLAGLNEGVIDSIDTSNVATSGNASLTRALAYSRNDYFQQVGNQIGFDAMLSYARKFGLGEKTGINMRNEFAGRIPDRKARPGIARMSSHGDDFQVTALQLATLVSAIGNGGNLLTPYVVRSRHDESKLRTKVRRQINLDSSAWRNILPGMVGTVNYGSGNKAQDPRQTVAGKTGTCIQGGEWVGLFTSFAPLSNPKLAVVVITRGADAHNHSPAAVAGRIYRGLDGRSGKAGSSQVATNRRTSTAKVEAASDERLSQFSDEDLNEMGNRTQLRSKFATPNSNAKPVLMEIRRVKESTAPKDVDDVTPSSDGQTRQRRVYGN